MKKKYIKFVFLSLFFFTSSIYAGGIVDKEYRQQFLSEQANKDYYRNQINVANFFDKQTSAVNNLVESYRGTSIYSFDILSGDFIYGSKGALDAQSFTYDSAMAAIAYLACGQPEKTAKILKAYQDEFYIKKSHSEFGIFNSYRTDKPAGNWGMVIGIDGDRMHVGPTIWIAIAALQYTAVTGRLEFLPFAIDISKWVDSLPHFKFRNGQRGAVSMGFGWGPDWSQVYSTENIVDNYAMLKILKEMYENGGAYIKKVFERKEYSLLTVKKEMFNIERWLMEIAFDKTKKTFNMGYNEGGVDKGDALDTVSWTIAAIGPERLVEIGVDPFYLMKFADDNYLVQDDVETEKIQGYDFTNYKTRKKDYTMVWFEGTGFHIVAMQVMANFSEKHGFTNRANYFKQKSKFFLNEMQRASDLCNLIDGALPYTSKKPDEKEIFTTFHWEWEIPRGKDGQWVSSASSTAWFIIALSAFNPLSLDVENINYKLFNK